MIWSPVAISLLVMAAVPAVVTTLVRRNDRKRPPASVVGDEARGVLFTVRARRWNYLMFRILGILFIVVGGFFFLVSLAAIGDPDMLGPLLTGFGICLAGILFVLLGVGMKRRRIEAYDSYLLVTPMFRAPQQVGPGAITRIRPTTNRLGGLDIKAKDYRGTITVIAIDAAYGEFCLWLEQRAPGVWAEFVRVFGR